MTFSDSIETVGKAVDAVGVAVIVIGALLATYQAWAKREASGRGEGLQEHLMALRLVRARQAHPLRNRDRWEVRPLPMERDGNKQELTVTLGEQQG